MISRDALQRAGQAWTGEKTACKTMDTELAEEFARMIDQIWTETRHGISNGDQVDRRKAAELMHNENAAGV